jgi:hypothetical protein
MASISFKPIANQAPIPRDFFPLFAEECNSYTFAEKISSLPPPPIHSVIFYIEVPEVS